MHVSAGSAGVRYTGSFPNRRFTQHEQPFLRIAGMSGHGCTRGCGSGKLAPCP